MRRATVLLALLAAGCGGDSSAGGTGSSATSAPAATSTPAVAGSSGRLSPAITSLAVDDASGTLFAGTGPGLFRVDAGRDRAEQITGRLDAGGAAAEVSSNLVVRSAAPGTLIASGHPEPGSQAPEDLGVIASSDGGRTWRSVGLLGEADLHALDARGDVVVGQPADEARIVLSRDGGRTFEERTPPEMPVDIDLDPADADTLLMTTAQGIYGSTDGGASWRRRDVVTVQTHLAWAEDGPLFRVDATGSVRISEDGGRSWREEGNAGGPPSTVTADAAGRLYVALPDAVIKRSDDGGRTFEQLVQISG